MTEPKRILLATKFYYRRGGDCIYTLNLEELLKANGHEVAVMAMQYPDNLPSQWSGYWPEEVSFAGPGKLNALKRVMGLGDVRCRMEDIISGFKPDVLHLNNIHSYLSPVIAQMAHTAGIRTVWTLHDYKCVCPAYSCTSASGQRDCERCISGSKINVVRERCMKGSLVASAVAFLEACRWNVRRLSDVTDAFVCPSEFMLERMRRGGFAGSKLHVLNNFISPQTQRLISEAKPGQSREAYYAYIGRISEEKGVRSLIEAAMGLPYTLKIAGDGPIADELKALSASSPNIQWLGHLDAAGVIGLMANARASVIPSEWYENNPLSVIECLCTGTPVVGSDAGGIPELIGAGTGRKFKSGDVEAMRDAIHAVWNATWDYEAISLQSLSKWNSGVYYKELMRIYNGND